MALSLAFSTRGQSSWYSSDGGAVQSLSQQSKHVTGRLPPLRAAAMKRGGHKLGREICMSDERWWPLQLLNEIQAGGGEWVRQEVLRITHEAKEYRR